jgi:hypothetical protein
MGLGIKPLVHCCGDECGSWLQLVLLADQLQTLNREDITNRERSLANHKSINSLHCESIRAAATGRAAARHLICGPLAAARKLLKVSEEGVELWAECWGACRTCNGGTIRVQA